MQHSEMLTALHLCTRKQGCKWPGRHCDPTGKLGTNLCLSAPGKCLFKGWEENGTFLLSILPPHLALPPRQRQQQPHFSRVDMNSQTCPYCLLTSDQSSLHVVQLQHSLDIPTQWSHPCIHQCHSTHDTGVIRSHHQCCLYVGVQAIKTNFIWYQKA